MVSVLPRGMVMFGDLRSVFGFARLMGLASATLVVVTSCEDVCPPNTMQVGDRCKPVIEAGVNDASGTQTSATTATADGSMVNEASPTKPAGDARANGDPSTVGASGDAANPDAHAGGSSGNAGTAGMVATGGVGGSTEMSRASAPSSSSDGHCPDGANAAGDPDCPPKCGNGVREGSELCDGADCVRSCETANACLVAALEGSQSTCDAHCRDPEKISACKSGDDCCPEGCTNAQDSDCSKTCGDGVVVPPELCEPTSVEKACPTSCDDGNPCTKDIQTGTPQQCNVVCTNMPITAPVRGDGCCPPGANVSTDDDCMVICGDGVVSKGETCEPGSRDRPCPTDCDDGNACSQDKLMGSARDCTAECQHTTIERTEPRSCDDGDVCTVDKLVDSTTACTKECRNEPMVRSGPNSCDDHDPCTKDSTSNSSTSCTSSCVNTRISGAVNGDGCCPAGVLRRDDNDCTTECFSSGDCQSGMECISGRCTTAPPRCGDGIVSLTEQCDDGNQDESDDCVDCLVALCGDGYVKASEECDPAAPGWEGLCSSLCTRTLYGICPVSGCKFGGEEVPCGSAGAYCSPICTQDSDCPPMPGHRIECAGTFQCTIRCSSGCPNGMHCINGDHCGYR
jgi:cysteine-rich repeat protein